jgi:glutamate transport system permease protein
MGRLDIAWEYFSAGFVETLKLAVLAYLLALVLGAVLAVMQVSPAAPARWASRTYIEAFKNVPLLAILVLFYLGLPKVGIHFDSFTWAVLGLGMYMAAFVCETLRSGINSIPLGQADAARALGLTFGQSLRFVVLPQAFRTVIPPMGGLFISLTKNTSLVIVMGVQEVASKTEQLINESVVNTLVIILGTVACYLMINLPASYLISRVERRAVFVR